MSRENGEEDGDDQVKVHEIKFDEFGIMDDGLDDTTHQKLNSAEPEGAEGATAIDEGLFEDEDLDELEDDLQNLEV